MKKAILAIEIGLILIFIADSIWHFMSATFANLLLFLFLATSFYLFKPYFIWSDLTKRRREMRDKNNRHHN